VRRALLIPTPPPYSGPLCTYTWSVTHPPLTSLPHHHHPATYLLVAAGSNRLQRENQRFALLTACADGGLAHACILEG